ncbi:Endonuclease/exonuclease/phosphatase [Mycena pura]|uniref:DNA-(apurinic or apyrimidinic site) endonuclease n=1 Tax=Mycena pura TaxID=153505 RepID=A0AAD7E5P4_9AGAR|nr:Endonuclease/exonuclease/phosphatase [Mycena pura]
MRILTWNINGVRTIPQYHPWNTFKTHDDILNHIQADIICFQEMKSSRQNLPKTVGAPPSYHAFFSFPQNKSGYSGVAVYARTAAVLPLKAEEGLTGLLQPTPPHTAAERVSTLDAYPDVGAVSADLVDLRALDSEGRALVLDFGLFVLINVYCPNDGTETEERLKYKADFHALLEARVRGLIAVERREVIVVGDLNACAAVMDHAEGPLIVGRAQAEGVQGEEGFLAHGARRWLRDWLISDDDGCSGNKGKGCLVDVVRRLHPDRRGMYTCWNTKISARESNYGTRIDYILVTPGLLPWIKAADIQPEVKGSDHCPVFIDLHDRIVDAHGGELKLSDVLGPGAAGAEPPRIATKFWDEYKQRLLSTFFGPKTDRNVKLARAPGPPEDTTASKVSPVPSSSQSEPETVSAMLPADAPFDNRLSSPSASASAKRKIGTQEPIASSSKKRKNKSASASKPNKGQTSLAAFFAKPKPAPASTSKSKTRTVAEPIVVPSPLSASSSEATGSDTAALDADYRLALALSQESDPGPPAHKSSSAWKGLLVPPAPPRCTVHGEPAKALTVTKPGPNKGKAFFICARPVGPGYDAGRGARRREEVDDQWRCDFFKWASEVRREEMARKGSTEG